VSALFKRIKEDDRHTSIVVQLAHPITQRQFPRFSTGEGANETEGLYIAGSLHRRTSCDPEYQVEDLPRSRLLLPGRRQVNDLITLTYTSVMLENTDPHADSSRALDAVIKIAEQAQVSNAAMLITGILVYNEATREVRQVLEGPRDNVLALIDCISQDPRHQMDSTQDMSISDIDTRSFGQWNMSLIIDQGSSSRRRRGTQPDVANVEEQIKGNLELPFGSIDEGLGDPEFVPGVF